jgi:hypothetical protein
MTLLVTGVNSAAFLKNNKIIHLLLVKSDAKLLAASPCFKQPAVSFEINKFARLQMETRAGRMMSDESLHGRKESRGKWIRRDEHRSEPSDTELGIRASCVTDMQQVAFSGVTSATYRPVDGELPCIKSFLNVLTIAV